MIHRLRRSAFRFSTVVFGAILFAASPFQAWAAPQITTVSGQQENVQVPSVSEPWSATVVRVTESPAPLPWHIGHYPGFREAKRQANERRKAMMSARPPSGETFVGPQNEQAPTVDTTAQTALASSTSGVVFDGPNESDTHLIPPDPQIAAGPNHVVVAVNSLLAIYDKSGNLQGSFQNFSSFFSNLGITGEIFDPRIIYDQTDQRFILSAGEIDFTNLTNGHVFLAVSASSDPTGTWYKFAINSMGRTADNTENTFPDFPGLGLSQSAVYITTNQYALTQACLSTDTEGCYFSDAWISVISLPELLSGNPNLNIRAFTKIQNAMASSAFAIQPALTYGSSSNEFLVAARYDSFTEYALDLFAIPTSGTPTLSTGNVGVPAYQIPPDAFQGGNLEPILTDDYRPLNAIWVNGSLFFGQNAFAGRVAARWYQITLSSLASASLAQSGDITGTGDAYYPAISLKGDGTLGIAFTTSSQFQFASSAFTGREPSDPQGTTRSYSIYRSGTDSYAEPGGFTSNRWGDYSGISVDPDGNSLWMITEYAGSPDPHFGTAAAQVAAPPSLSITPSFLNFGEILLGSTSPPQTVTVMNIGSASVAVGTATFSGANSVDFSISNDACSGKSIAAGQSCTLSITFKPSIQNIEEVALLSIPNAGGGLVTLSAVGAGILQSLITPSPLSLTFPPTTVSTASAPQTVTVTNTGNISTGTLSISASWPFTQTNNCPTTLSVNGSCQLVVTFRPLSGGTSAGRLVVSDSSNSGMVTLTGAGATAPAALLCPPTSLTYSSQTVNTASAVQTVIVTNNGSAILNIARISIAGDFSETNNCAGTLPAGGSCVINVAFAPVAAGSRTGTLSVYDDTVNSPQSLALTGSGTASSSNLLMIPLDVASALAPYKVSALLSGSAAQNDLPDKSAFAQRPLAFEQNTGQFRSGVEFMARAEGHSVGVTRSGILIELPSGSPDELRKPLEVRMALVGANPSLHPAGSRELPGKVNYFIGNDPSRWHTSVPTYGAVTLPSVYPGIDLVYYGNQRQLEYDFAIAPGANPGAIRLRFEGASHLHIAKSGDLVLGTALGEISFHKPVVFQPVEAKAPPFDQLMALTKTKGRRQLAPSARSDTNPGRPPGAPLQIPVDGRYVLTVSNEVRFEIGPYDKSRQLIIDPVLSFSTYLAGTGGDTINGIALDPSGNIFVTGTTSSADFPVTTGAFQQTCGGSIAKCVAPYLTNAFVSKLSADGSTLIYSTFLGGGFNFGSQANAIFVDSAGNAYVDGSTTSSDFPVTPGAFQTQCKTVSGGTACASAFVTKLNASGSALVYSTYLGGSPVATGGQAMAITVDARGNAYVAGNTSATDFPTTPGAFESTITPVTALGYTHGFFTELNSSGSNLVYSTYLGGTANESANGIALDAAGNIYVAGETGSLDFPTTAHAIQSGPRGNPDDFFAGFITKFDPTGKVTYSTYTTGPGLAAIAADSAGSAYVAGSSPLTGASVATKLHPAGCAVLYSAPLPEIVYGAVPTAIAVDHSGDAFVVGKPGGFSGGVRGQVINPVQAPSLGGAFVGEINPTGTLFPFWTSLGGSTSDSANAIAVDSQDNIYVAGGTQSPDFPTTPGAFQSDCPACTYNGGSIAGTGAFIAKIGPGNLNGVFLSRSELTFAPFDFTRGFTQSQVVGLLNSLAVPLNIFSVTLSGGAYSLASPTTSDCSGTITPGAGCTVRVLFKPTAQGPQPGTLTITDSGPGSPRTVALNGFAGAPFTLTATPQFSGVLFKGAKSVNYLVSVPAVAGVSPLPGEVNLSCFGVTCISKPVAINGQTILTVTPIAGESAFDAGQISFTLKGTYLGQAVSLPITFSIEDFYISLYSPQSVTVTAGQSAAYSITVSPHGGFNFPVSLACTGAPALATCSISPPSLTLDGTNSNPVTVTVTTTARSSSPPSGHGPHFPRGFHFGVPPLWLSVLAVFLSLLAATSGRRRRAWLGFALIVIAVGLWISCGGGSSSGGAGGPPPAHNGTPAGTFTLTVTATSSSAGGSLTDSYDLTLGVL